MPSGVLVLGIASASAQSVGATLESHDAWVDPDPLARSHCSAALRCARLWSSTLPQSVAPSMRARFLRPAHEAEGAVVQLALEISPQKCGQLGSRSTARRPPTAERERMPQV